MKIFGSLLCGLVSALIVLTTTGLNVVWIVASATFIIVTLVVVIGAMIFEQVYKPEKMPPKETPASFEG